MELDGENGAEGSLSSPTNTSSQLPLKSPVYTAFLVILAISAFVAVLLKIWTIAALTRDSAVLKTLRVLLINIFMAELLISAAIITDTTSSAIRSAGGANHTIQPQHFCRFLNWLFAASVAARMYGLTAYIAAVVVYVKCGWKKLKAIHVALSLAAMWTLAAVFGVDRWIPQATGAIYLQGVMCSTVVHESVILSARLTFGTLWILFGGLIPLIICFILTVVAIYQLRQQNMQDSAVTTQYRKSVAKLASFFIIGNFVNLFCICLPSLGSIISSFPQAKVDGVAVVTIFLSALTLSLYPTHVIVMICMQTVRQQMTVIICHCQICCHHRKGVTEELEMKAMTLLVVDSGDRSSNV